MRKTAFLIGVEVSLLLAGPLFARVIEVPHEFGTIQEAIDDSNDGDTIVVSPGAYARIDFNDKNIAVVSSNPDDLKKVTATIIDGGVSSSPVTFASGEGPGRDSCNGADVNRD